MDKSQITNSFLSLTLGALLLIQGSIFFLEPLSRVDAARPTLTKFCHWFACKLPIKRDLSKFAISGRDLQTHPQLAQSLRLKATLTNAATFAQPYPRLHLEFTDLSGKVVASRQLNARDYLIDHQDNKLMPANSEMQIVLDLVDPGKNASGFALSLKDGQES